MKAIVTLLGSGSVQADVTVEWEEVLAGAPVNFGVVTGEGVISGVRIIIDDGWCEVPLAEQAFVPDGSTVTLGLDMAAGYEFQPLTERTPIKRPDAKEV